MKSSKFTLLIFMFLMISSCSKASRQQIIEDEVTSDTAAENSSNPITSPAEQNTAFNNTTIESDVPDGALSIENLIYIGAFRLPDDSGGMGWGYSGQGMTYYPGGDPNGPSDGFSGSLFIVGHDQELFVAEVSIPHPVISENLDDLNTAQTLQPFADITGGFITHGLDIPIFGIEYLPACNDLNEETLHFAAGQHFQGFEASHGCASLDLGDPNQMGLWHFDGFTNYTTNDYLFSIPEECAVENVSGYPLVSGRFREGVWGGLGPVLFAYSPCMGVDPLEPGGTLADIQPLLLYGKQIEGETDIISDETTKMNVYAESDHWWGGAWLTSDYGDSVIFTGTKALGENWYGFANGAVWEYDCAENPEYDCPEVPEFPYDNRGYWADDFIPAILFFNPDDLARVAKGEIQTYDPQPYALMDLSEYWYDPNIHLELYKRDIAGSAAYDRENGLLFIVERLGDGDKSLIHVFKIGME
jgi:hypothetical protein